MFEFDPYSHDVDVNPYPFYKTLRDEYPCYWSALGDCWVLSRHEDIQKSNVNWQVFSSAQGNMLDDIPERAGSTLGTTDPPRHDRLRNLVQAAFATKNVEYLIPPIQDMTNAAIDQFIDKGRFEFISDFSSPITVGTLSYLLGIPPEEHRTIRDNVVKILQTDPVTRQKPKESMDAFHWLLDYIDDMLAARKKNPTDDILTALLQAEIDGDKLKDSEIRMTSLTVVMAGVESASSFMSLFAMNLADHPDSRARLLQDPGLVADALEESLRFNTSAQRFRRTLATDFEMHGQQMKQGDKVLLMYGSANRDERKWENADVYDIDRKPRGHLGMGTGKHMCLGAPIARLLVRTAIQTLHERVQDYRKVQPELDWIKSTTFRAPVAMDLEFG